ncbi:DUF1700 domain-containing protein [Collinsella sp. zg1085]|uniref:DUF1700 domain-containing protein n=1 Tax=Collinsella sp. zg1085 TaxID=2844380 RepID=UPI001C0D7284|nr:DUF1700 domain-containing protein [Collinsella sp. zg1085]QWT17360.1 DUF1700 domain-containing protein [Collinsella sp. zg1085]
MNKKAYLSALSDALSSLSPADRQESLDFYAEMIDERVADNMTEEEAVAELDEPAVAAETIINELPVVPRTVARGKRNYSKLFWILVILGSPLWLSILLALCMSVFTAVVIIWTCSFGFVIATGAFLFAPFIGIGSAVQAYIQGEQLFALWQLGSSLFVFGLGLCMLSTIRAVLIYPARWSKALFSWLRSLFKKEVSHGAK